MTESLTPDPGWVASRAEVRVLSADTPMAALQLAVNGQGPLVAGATWLQPVWERQGRWPAKVVPVSAEWEGFSGVTVRGKCLEVGALTTLNDFARNPDVAERLPAIAALMDRIAGPAVRHLGTVVGNLVAGGDLSAPALVLNARLRVLTPSGWKMMPMADWSGACGLIASVVFDAEPETRVLVEKLGHREAFSPTRITLACARVQGQRRVAVCGEGGPVRLLALEQALARTGVLPGPEQCEQALAAMDWGGPGLRLAGGRLMAYLLAELEA